MQFESASSYYQNNIVSKNKQKIVYDKKIASFFNNANDSLDRLLAYWAILISYSFVTVKANSIMLARLKYDRTRRRVAHYA